MFNSKLYDSEVGSYSYFVLNVLINIVLIGNYCIIAPNVVVGVVVVGTIEHDYRILSISTILFDNHIKIVTVLEDDVWIGANSVVKIRVILGRVAFIAAVSLVLKDVSPLSIAVGSRAKILKKRFDDRELVEQYFNIDFAKKPAEIKTLLDV